MNKETILDYATRTPENTNRNVLSGMLDSLLADNGNINIQEPLILAIINLINNYNILYTTELASFDPQLNEVVEESRVRNEANYGLSIKPNGSPLTAAELRQYSSNILICDLDKKIVFLATMSSGQNLKPESGWLQTTFSQPVNGTTLNLDSWSFKYNDPGNNILYGCRFKWSDGDIT